MYDEVSARRRDLPRDVGATMIGRNGNRDGNADCDGSRASERGSGRGPAPDDLDRLFARLAPVEPPAALASVVLARTTRRPARVGRRELALGAVDLIALVGLAAISVSLGWSLSDSGAAELLAAVLGDLAAFAEAWTDVLPVLVEGLPWAHLIVMLADVAVVAVVSRRLIATCLEPGPTGPAGERA
jgi:hypothetical protein